MTRRWFRQCCDVALVNKMTCFSSAGAGLVNSSGLVRAMRCVRCAFRLAFYLLVLKKICFKGILRDVSRLRDNEIPSRGTSYTHTLSLYIYISSPSPSPSPSRSRSLSRARLCARALSLSRTHTHTPSCDVVLTTVHAFFLVFWFQIL